MKKLTKILWFIFVFPILSPVFLLFGALGLYAYIDLIFSAIFTKRKMRKQNRNISKKTLKNEITEKGIYGTFILESYTIGWGVERLWWTPDVIPKNDEIEPLEKKDTNLAERMSTAYHCDIYDTYTNLDKGRAYLWKTWARRSVSKEIALLFPNTQIVEVWSGGIEMKRRFDSQK